jgi:dienelactone hydrolase
MLPSDMTKPAVRDRPVRGTGRLYRPAAEASTKRPAIVVLQGLGGPKTTREHRYGEWLAKQGLVALVPRTFGSRSHGDSEHTWRALRVTTAMMTADAFASLKYLRSLPYVDPDAIFIVGFSYGGMVSILTAYDQMRRYFLDDGPTFAGHVSYYGCSIPRMDDTATSGAPVLIILGGKDDNVSITRTRDIAEDLRRGGSPVELHVFDQAYHQWDSGETKRELLNLRRCRIRIDREGRLHDEKTGRKLEGWLSRALYLLLNVGWGGYRIKRDDGTAEKSNAMLLTFLNAVRRGEDGTAPAQAAPSRDAGAAGGEPGGGSVAPGSIAPGIAARMG